MATYEQIPAVGDISAIVGDDLTVQIAFGINLAGYSFTGAVGDQTPTVTVTDSAAGNVSVVLSAAQTTAIGVGKVHWYLVWTLASKQRTVVAGDASFTAR